MEIKKVILGFHVVSKHKKNLIHLSNLNICLSAMSGWSVLCVAYIMEKMVESLPIKSL